jgi:hypothetical protein
MGGEERIKCGNWDCMKMDFYFSFDRCSKCKTRRYCSSSKYFFLFDSSLGMFSQFILFTVAR